LEIIHRISLEEIEQRSLFSAAEEILRYIHQNAEQYHRGQVRQALFNLLAQQGIEAPASAPAGSVSELVEVLLGHPVRSFAYLRV